MKTPVGDIIEYGRDVLGYRDPDALGRFIDVIQFVEAEILER